MSGTFACSALADIIANVRHADAYNIYYESERDSAIQISIFDFCSRYPPFTGELVAKENYKAKSSSQVFSVESCAATKNTAQIFSFSTSRYFISITNRYDLLFR